MLKFIKSKSKSVLSLICVYTNICKLDLFPISQYICGAFTESDLSRQQVKAEPIKYKQKQMGWGGLDPGWTRFPLFTLC